MFTIDCPICGQELLVGPRRIEALHQTAEGPVAEVRCPRGHLVVHEFRHGRTTLPGETAVA